ncbi:E3 ubiquitin-protein ligase RLIM-like [Tupaia chinensis]|uniref:E3 ubiquitin-protein ligase RLIM-like n=1 Tax=Tupaia chinensis TaxID=246437 RepID=UPI0003C8E8F4|nr:E3 ubiquitin-protein ligase RLIM-like [Tupaia chinensis]
MDKCDSDEEDEKEGSVVHLGRQMDRSPREDGFHQFENHSSEEEYVVLRDSELSGTVGDCTEPPPPRSLTEVKEDPPQQSGGGDSSPESGNDSTILGLTSLGQIGRLSGWEQREHQSYTAANQSHFNYSDIRSSGGMGFILHNGRRISRNACTLSERFSRGVHMELGQRQIESLPPVSTFARPSTLERRHVPEASMEVPPPRGQRRARSRSPEQRRTRARTENTSPPNSMSENVQRFEQPLINETERVSVIPPHDTSRQQLTGPELQSRHLFPCPGFPCSRTRNTVPRGHFLDALSNCDNVELRQSYPTRFVDYQVTGYRAECLLIDRLASGIQLLSEISNNIVTSENEQQERPRNIFSHSEEVGGRPFSTIIFPADRTLNTGLYEASVQTQNTSGQMVAGFQESSNPIDSDRDLETGVSLLSQNMEGAESQDRRNNSDDSHSSSSNSYPRCHSRSSSVSVFSSRSSYVLSSDSSPISDSSSSSSENSDISSLMFEASNEGSVSLGLASETSQESGHRSPVTSDESDSWPAPDLAQFILLNEAAHSQAVGLTEQQIDSLAVRYFDHTDTLKSCSICITEYTEGNKLRILPCSHEYHVHCIDRWLSQNITCPICRRKVVDSDRESSS